MALSNAERQQRHRDRQKKELATLRAAAKRTAPAATTEPAVQREKKTKVPIPTHARALRFDWRKRPYDPVCAAEFLSAFFRECPAEHKPHLLARIEMLVRDVKPAYGGFKFTDHPVPLRNDSAKQIEIDPEVEKKANEALKWIEEQFPRRGRQPR